MLKVTPPKQSPKVKTDGVTTASQKQSPEAQKKASKPKKKRKASGSSLGWGFFQGFNLFLTFVILLGLGIVTYIMVGGENRHQGLPKYVLDQATDNGQVIFNPQIPEEVRQSYIYVPPVKEEINAEELEQIEQIAKAPDFDLKLSSVGETVGQGEGSSTATDDQDSLPKLSLTSVGSDALNDANAEDFELERAQVQIESFIDQAQHAMSEGRYVGVNHDDAYYFYTQVLFLDVENPVAKAGLHDIANLYFQNAQKALYEGDLTNAETFIKVGLVVMPNHRELLQLEDEFKRYLETMRLN